MLHVLAHHRDPHLMLGVHDPPDHLTPLRQIERGRFQAQPLDQNIVKPVLDQAQREPHRC